MTAPSPRFWDVYDGGLSVPVTKETRERQIQGTQQLARRQAMRTCAIEHAGQAMPRRLREYRFTPKDEGTQFTLGVVV